MLRVKAPDSLQLSWQGMLADYGTAIVWTPDGTRLVACSAAGEVLIYEAETGCPRVLQPACGQSVNVLSISPDGRFLAAAGQAGTVVIWQIEGNSPQVLMELTYPQEWIDRLQWHPQRPELAFGFGRYVQVWDALTQTILTTLNFADSSVLDLAWHPQGEHLTVSGNQWIKTWQCQDWEEDPLLREISAASGSIAWSPDGLYLASGNNDRSVLVWQDGNEFPWRMQGFPGKVRRLAWSAPASPRDTPILASISANGIVIWRKAADPSVGWSAQILDLHRDTVTAIAFQPGSGLLASAAEDGWVCLWNQANELVQVLQGAPKGFSALVWNPQGTELAMAGHQGELLVWKQVWKQQTRGQGLKGSRVQGFG